MFEILCTGTPCTSLPHVVYGKMSNYHVHKQHDFKTHVIDAVVMQLQTKCFKVRFETSKDPAAWGLQFCSFVLLVFFPVDSHTGMQCASVNRALRVTPVCHVTFARIVKKIRLLCKANVRLCTPLHTSWWRISWIGLKEADVADILCFCPEHFSAKIFLLVITCIVTSSCVSYHKTCILAACPSRCCRTLFCKPNHCVHALLIAF